MKLTYIGEPDMVYPTLGLEPVPGQDYDLDEAPLDGRWATVGTDPTPITPDKPDPAEPAQTAGSSPPPAQEPAAAAEAPAEPAAQPAAPSTAPAAADQPVTTTDAATMGA